MYGEVARVTGGRKSGAGCGAAGLSICVRFERVQSDEDAVRHLWGRSPQRATRMGWRHTQYYIVYVELSRSVCCDFARQKKRGIRLCTPPQVRAKRTAATHCYCQVEPPVEARAKPRAGSEGVDEADACGVGSYALYCSRTRGWFKCTALLVC